VSPLPQTQVAHGLQRLYVDEPLYLLLGEELFGSILFRLDDQVSSESPSVDDFPLGTLLDAGPPKDLTRREPLAIFIGQRAEAQEDHEGLLSLGVLLSQEVFLGLRLLELLELTLNLRPSSVIIFFVIIHELVQPHNLLQGIQLSPLATVRKADKRLPAHLTPLPLSGHYGTLIVHRDK